MSKVSRLIRYYETVQQFINDEYKHIRRSSVPIKRNYDKRSHSSAVFDKCVTPARATRLNNNETGAKGYLEVTPEKSVSPGTQSSWQLQQLDTKVSEGIENTSESTSKVIENIQVSKETDNTSESKGTGNNSVPKGSVSRGTENTSLSKGIENIPVSKATENIPVSKATEKNSVSEGTDSNSVSQGTENTSLSKGSVSRGTEKTSVSKGTENTSLSKGSVSRGTEKNSASKRTENILVSKGTEKSSVSQVTENISVSKGTENTSVLTGTQPSNIRSSEIIDDQKLILKSKSGKTRSGLDNETEIDQERVRSKEDGRSSQRVVYPGKEDILTVSEVVCSKSAVSCVSRTDKNEAGEDVRVPISGGGRMINTSTPVPSPQTREMNPTLPLNLMELNIARSEDSSEREIVLVRNKTQAEMTGKTRQQNRDQDGDVNQDEGRGRGCDAGPHRITSLSCHASNLKPASSSIIFDKELFE